MSARSCGLGARRVCVVVVLSAMVGALGGCETLPGFGQAPAPEPVAEPHAVVGPPPPPARPRGPVASRFRGDLLAAHSGEASGVPQPPPPSPGEPLTPTIRAESMPAAPATPVTAAPVPAPPPVAAATPAMPPPAAPLEGDSAASEVARAEPAAPPPPARPVPRPGPTDPLPAFSIDPASIIGANAFNIRERFGAPDRQTPIGSGMTWHYERGPCKASLVLLPELTSGTMRVFSHEITLPDGANFGPASCLGRIAAARADRTAGASQ